MTRQPEVIYRARFWFDPGSGVCLWGADTATVEAFNYPIDTRRLPLTDNLRYALDALIAIFNTSIDWDYPPDPSPWSAEQWQRWRQSGDELLIRLRAELGAGWEIHDERNLDHGNLPGTG
jgi:hypothetical protein